MASAGRPRVSSRTYQPGQAGLGGRYNSDFHELDRLLL